LPEQTSAWESTNVPDLYFAGTLMQVRDYKKSASAFIHGFRYNIRTLSHILAQKYHGQPWPSHLIRYDPETLTDYVIRRVNSASSLWQQFGYLCDVIIPSDQEQTARYYENIPVDYVHDTALGHNPCYYIVTLEYGSHHTSEHPFNIHRIDRHDTKNANLSNFLHPIIRHFFEDEQVSEHHIIEDLEGRWIEDIHVNPLVEYFTHEISFMYEFQNM
jgi:hypothetical protein